MKKIYLCIALAISTISTIQSQTTGQLMDYSLSYIGTNGDTGNAEIALVATPDFTSANGNSADMGAIVSISGGGYLLPGNTGFVNDCVFTPPASNVCEYDIPATEWDAIYMANESTASGRFVYQLLRTPGTTNVFFDAVAGDPIIMAVFQVTNGSGAPTTGDIVLIKNTDPLLDSNTAGNEDYLNINFPGLSGGTIDLYPGDPNPGDDGFTPGFTPINFSTLGLDRAELEGFGLFPNPAKNVVTIKGLKTSLQSIELYNLAGQRLMSSTSNLQTLDVSTYSNGVYFVKLNTANSSKTIKLIKE